MVTEQSTQQYPAAVEMPAPTPWPMVLALGVAFIFVGLMSNSLIAITGAVILLVAAIGWWREVLPAEHHELIAVAGEPGPLAVQAPIPVAYLRGRRRSSKPAVKLETKPWAAGLKGGMVGAVAMAGVALFFGLLIRGSVWYPINLLAAAALPGLANASIEQLKEFNSLGLILGAIIHVSTSLLVGVLYAVMLPMFPRKAFWWAGVSAPILWSGLIASIMNLVNPALSARVDWRWFVASQLAFGLTGGFVVARSMQIESREDLPLAVRAGIEAPGVGRSGEEQK
jgi:uncharacterized membrane protein YagU involved in acid resistance